MDRTDERVDESIYASASTQETRAAAEEVVAVAIHPTATSFAKLLVNAGRTVNDEDDLLALLQRVVEIAHQAIAGADSAGVTIDLGGRTYTAVHTDQRTLRVDCEQYDAGDGPCLHASRTGEIVVLDAEDAMGRWPRFAAAAREEGIRSFLAAPLATDELSLGSFNLYGRSVRAFGSLDAEVLELLTITVSRTIADFARFKSARDVADSIQRALHTRAPIEQAKGMLMALHGIDGDRAFDMLRRESQDNNVKLGTIAADFVARLSQGTERPAV